MYQHILIPLENSKTDSVILEYIRPLARFTNARLTIIMSPMALWRETKNNWLSRRNAQGQGIPNEDRGKSAQMASPSRRPGLW